MKNTLRFIATVFIALMAIAPCPLSASERELIDLANDLIERREYYSAITEMMRYQFLYPGGKRYAESMLIMGKAYFRGGNYYLATAVVESCYSRFGRTPEGQQALIGLGSMRLLSASPEPAYRSFREYALIHPGGMLSQEASIGIAYARALQYDLTGAMRADDDYRSAFPDGRYVENLRQFRYLIESEVNRPRKSMVISVAGSILVPGFGHFYTGRYLTGLLSFATNAVLIFLIYDAWRDDNSFRMLVFGAAELAFYQYSVYSAVRNVYEYNSREAFFKSVRLAFPVRF